MGLDQYLNCYNHENNVEHELYFRKINFLHKFMEEMREEPIEDLEICDVPAEVLQELVYRCQRVLDNPSEGPTLLPTMEGFFFGSIEYDQEYLEDVEYVKETVESVLGKYEDYSYMAWW